MSKYLIFDIEAIEHLKVGSFNRDEGNESANTYISGSAIRGALIWKWLKKIGGELPKDLVNGTIKVYNAYPLYDDQMSLPMPACFGGKKEEMKGNKNILNLNNFLTEGKKENEIPYKSGGYIITDGKKAEAYQTQMMDRLHINKKIKDAKNDMKLFRYEAIEKGERFRSAIKVTDEYCQKIKKLLTKEQFYIGGARGGGYGCCAISHVEESSSLEAYYGQGLRGKEDDTKDVKKLYIYFISDTILYYNGTVSSTIPTIVLKDRLGLTSEPVLIDSQVTLMTATTFNGMYKTNTIHYSAVSKGSLLVYEVETLPSDASIKALEEEGIGLRQEDGLGMVQVLTSMPRKLELTKMERKQEINIDFSSLNKEDQKEVTYIAQSVYNTRRKQGMYDLILKVYQPNKNLPKTQLGKIFNLLEGMTDVNNTSSLKAYLEHMEAKDGKRAWHNLAGVKLSLDGNQTNLQELLSDFTKGSSNKVLEAVLKSIDSVTIGQVTYPDESNKKEILVTKKIFITEYIYLLMRLKGDQL